MICKNPALVLMVLAVCSTACWSFWTAPPPPLPRHGWTSSFRSSSSSSSTPPTTTKSSTTKQMATALIDLLVPLAVKVNIDQTNVTLAQYQALEKAVWRSVVVQAKQQQQQHEISSSNAQTEEEILEEESPLVEELSLVDEESTPDVIQSPPVDEEEKAAVMEEKVDLPVHEKDVSLGMEEETITVEDDLLVGDNNEEAPSRFFPSIISKSFGKPLDVIESIATPSIPKQEEEVLSSEEKSETVDAQKKEVESVVEEAKEEPPPVEEGEIEEGITAELNEEEPEADTEERKIEDPADKEMIEEVASVDDKPDEPVSIVAEEESKEVDAAVDDIVADTNPTTLEEPAAKEPSDMETKNLDPLVELFATPRTPLVSTLYAPTFMTEEQIQQARKSPKSPQEQARLTARYAAIADVGDRAFCILVDLGMIGDSTNYTSRFDQFWELLDQPEEVSPQPVGGASSSATSSSTSSTQLSMLGDEQREDENPLPPAAATRLSMMVSPFVQRLAQRVLAKIQNKWDWVLNRVAVGIWRRRSIRPAWVQRRLAAKYAALGDPQDRAAAVLNDLGI